MPPKGKLLSVPGSPARAEDTSVNFHKFRSFIRVRPFTDIEATIVPPDQIVPRPVLVYSPEEYSLTVLDPQAKFRPKRKGDFESENIFWFFKDDDPENDIPRNTFDDFYKKVVIPTFPAMDEGYGAAFIFTGGTQSGKSVAMLGDDSNQDGLFVRFTREFFEHKKRNIPENATFDIQAEFVEVDNEQYVDLLSNKKGTILKVREDPTEGIVLSGVTRVHCENSKDLLRATNAALKKIGKRKATFGITLRITEKHTFVAPEESNIRETVKYRRSVIHFIMIRNPTLGMKRCFDAAITRDTENSLTCVPYRESAFAKLYADIFNQNSNVSIISCVSPFYKDVKETMQMLEFAVNIVKVKTSPHLNEDNSMLELRRLADEMRDLDRDVLQTNESMKVVQEELDKRQIELEKEEKRYSDLEYVLNQAQDLRAVIATSNKREKRKYEADNLLYNAELKRMDSEIMALEKQIELTQSEISGIKDQQEAARQDVKRADEDHKKQQQLNEIFEKEVAFIEQEERELQEMEHYISSDNVERQEKVTKLIERTQEMRQSVAQLEKELIDAEKKEEKVKEEAKGVEAVYQSYKADYEEINKKKKEVDTLKNETRELETDISNLQSEIARLEEENRKAPKGCCSVM